MRGLEKRTTLITGAASGIGRAIARRLGGHGSIVGIIDRDGPGAQKTAASIEAAGGQARAYEVDITDPVAVRTTVDQFAEEFGSLQSLVNNAGWDLAGKFLESDPDLWRKIVDINLMGPLHVTHAALPHMLRGGWGRVVSIASDAGRVGSSGEAVYAACKGGIVAFSKSVAREMARENITLNIVSPGPSDTPLFANFDPSGKLAKALERAIPMGRLGRPEDYPGIVAFLLSDDAAFITGQTVSVSGGLTMHG